MRIPTTEFCEICAQETPQAQLAKAGRARVRVFQDLDNGEYSCERGHRVIIETNEPGVVIEREIPGPLVVEKPLAHVRLDGVTAPESAQDTAVAVAEEPQAYQAQIVPGSSRMRQGGALELTLLVPEQYVGPLQSYCQGTGKSVEQFINEVVANGFENGWFV